MARLPVPPAGPVQILRPLFERVVVTGSPISYRLTPSVSGLSDSGSGFRLSGENQSRGSRVIRSDSDRAQAWPGIELYVPALSGAAGYGGAAGSAQSQFLVPASMIFRGCLRLYPKLYHSEVEPLGFIRPG